MTDRQDNQQQVKPGSDSGTPAAGPVELLTPKNLCGVCHQSFPSEFLLEQHVKEKHGTARN